MKPDRANRRQHVLIVGLLALVTVAVYWPVRHFEFLNFDDPAYVTANPNVFRGLTSQNVGWAFTSFAASNWHPVTWLSHMLDCQMFGHRPGLHHLTNLFLHAANTLLLFGLFRRLTGAVLRSAVIAALFAWHPLHVESVAWVAERKDVLSTFFGLLAFHTYVRYAVPTPGKKSNAGIWYGLTILLLALGLMSKPMLVTWPFVLLLFDFWPLRRLSAVSWPRLLLEKTPFFLLSAATCAVTMLAQKEAILAKTVLPVGSRLVNAVMAYAGYLRKMIWPVDLAAYYPYRHNLPAGEIAVALLVLLSISVVAVYLAQRAPYLLFGWLWYLGMLVPVIGLVQVGAQAMADRYTYLPLVGIFIMIVWGAAELGARNRRRELIAVALSLVLLAACLPVTWRQVQYWRDSETLFRRSLQVCPEGNAMAHHCLGRALFLRGDDAGAIPHYQEVLRLLPDYPDGHLSMGNSLNRQEKYAEAMFHYHEAIRLDPDNAEAYKSLGSCLAAQMKLEEARTNFLTALRLKPDYAQAHTRLGTLLMAQGKVDAALQHLTKATEIYPDFDEGQYYLANALVDQKRFAEATARFRAAIKANPDYAAAYNDLAWMLATQVEPTVTNFAEAVRLAGRACELTQNKNASYLETLGIAFSEAGRFSEAIIATETAAALATAQGQPEVANQMLKRLQNYRAGRSFSGRTGNASPPSR